MPTDRYTVWAPGEGLQLGSEPGRELTFKLTGDETGGAFDYFIVGVAPKNGPPLHVHHREDEYFVMLDGEITLHLPGESRRVGAGEAAFAPRCVPHTYRIESEEARWLAISNPSGFASFVGAVADPAESETLPPADGPVGLEHLEAAAAEHGIELIAPPGTLP